MNIIPLPNKIIQKPGKFVLNANTTVNLSNTFQRSKIYFLDYIKGTINLDLLDDINAKIIFTLNIHYPQEGYIIDIDETSLHIHARDDQGAFYAIQTLKQIAVNNNGKLNFDCCYIEDYPMYPYRGFMLDLARHFFKKDVIYKLIDYLAIYKLNYLHLHLSDDQGFRIQIDKYPLLTKVGSTRSKTKQRKGYYANYVHEGYFTKSDIKEIISYAKDNFIEVIPEIDLPGHTTAILAAYPEYSCTGEKVEVKTDFGKTNNVLCVGDMNTYSFIQDILEEVIEIFPSKFIHIGGDVVNYSNWHRCPKCRSLMKQAKIKSYKGLARYFTNYLSNYLREKNKVPIAWNDLINKEANYNIVTQHWRPLTKRNTIKEINDGRKAIMSNSSSLYFNFPYTMTPLNITYNFNPVLKGVMNIENILGVESVLWTEWINNKDKLEEHIIPRLAAISEVAWTNPIYKNYKSFCERLNGHNNLYDKLLINYKQNATKQYSFGKRIIKTIKWFNGKDAN